MSYDARIKIILDTDIGDDIDDAFALSFILGSPEFELLGVTTVYGDVATRAKIARRMLRLAGRGNVPVYMGWERPFGFDYHQGTAPENCSQRQAVADDAESLPALPRASEFIIECAQRHPGQVHVLTIGAKTNVGAALCIEPALAGQLAGVVSLAGYCKRLAEPEWNVRYDPAAAGSIARSGVKWTAIGADVQNRNGLTAAEFKAIQDSGTEYGKFLLELVYLMHRYKGKGNPAIKSIADVKGAHVADVMSAASFLIPQHMGLEPGRVDVDARGAMQFTPDPAGPHRLATALVPENSYRPEILRRILAAAR